MKKLLFLAIALMLAGCVAVPVYDDAYYYRDYGPSPYVYAGPEVSFFFAGSHGGHHHYGGGHGFHGGHRGGWR